MKVNRAESAKRLLSASATRNHRPISHVGIGLSGGFVALRAERCTWSKRPRDCSIQSLDIVPNLRLHCHFMTFKKIAECAADLKRRREAVTFCEGVLQQCVAAFCDQYHGSLRDMAGRMGITVQYLSDIRHGRRKVSDSVVEKLGKLR